MIVAVGLIRWVIAGGLRVESQWFSVSFS